MLFLEFLLLWHCFLFAYSSVLQILPSTYSQYFDIETPKPRIPLSESFFSGEENQESFSISLWMKIMSLDWEGEIFSIQKYFDHYSLNHFYYFPLLYYTLHGSLALRWENKNSTLRMELKIMPSNDWIFLAISASAEMKSGLFYYNGLGNEIYKLENLSNWVNIWHESVLQIGGYKNFLMRIGDFKFYNNFYKEASDWGVIYSNACSGISCTDLFPSICYAQCDQWCKNEAEWFVSLIQPDLFGSTPYYQVQKSAIIISNVDVFNGVNVPTNGWNDYSITGWVQFPVCYSKLTTFFLLIDALKIGIFDISLTGSSISNLCDTLEATIYNENSSNSAFSSVSLSSLSFIGSWLFFAATVNSGSRLLTFYAQNGANYPSSLYPLLSSSIAYPYVAIPFSSSINIHIGGSNAWDLYPGNYADFRIYPGNHIDATLLQYNNNIYSPATYLDPHCVSWSSIWYCKTCENGYFIKNGICQKCHFSCAKCISDGTETNCLSCASGYYAQPGHPSICFDYCPLGYTWNSSLNQCTGTKGIIANINFDNNLSGDIIFSNVCINFGFTSDYYPNFEFSDPLPANKRGVYLSSGNINMTPQASAQARI